MTDAEVQAALIRAWRRGFELGFEDGKRAAQDACRKAIEENVAESFEDGRRFAEAEQYLPAGEVGRWN